MLDALVADLRAGERVVFDADGTLWRGDVGEDFLRWALHRKLFSGSYATYEHLMATEPAKGLAWAVEVMAGLHEDELQAHARAFFTERFVGRVFPYVRPLLKKLAAQEVWICSASPRWVVLPGAEHLGIDPARVIGVTCEVRDGRLTGAVNHPVPAGPGKVIWLQKHGVAPALSVGNGDTDVDMLAFSRKQLVIGPPDSANGLVRHARANSWPVLLA
jgi:phosphoserine phosphatase